MKKRALSLLLALALLAGLSVSGAHAEAPETGSADVSANVLHLGGLLPAGSKPLLRGSGNLALKQTLYNGLSAWAETIDISAYGVSVSDISAIYAQVLNEHPDLFYVTGGFRYRYSGNVVTAVLPYYDDSYSSADVAAYQNATQRILGMLEPGWSDMEKLLFLHDYLVTHCEYDLTYSNYSAYDALVIGSAVCQGYAEAFRDLCVRSGIACSLISSDDIDHAWNLVTLEGENFYIDCTWDDPSNQWYEGRCQHEIFCSARRACQRITAEQTGPTAPRTYMRTIRPPPAMTAGPGGRMWSRRCRSSGISAPTRSKATPQTSFCGI